MQELQSELRQRQAPATSTAGHQVSRIVGIKKKENGAGLLVSTRVQRVFYNYSVHVEIMRISSAAIVALKSHNLDVRHGDQACVEHVIDYWNQLVNVFFGVHDRNQNGLIVRD